jgi:precorrin-6B methylase 2
MFDTHHPDPAETYEHYLGPTIADPWTRVLLAYAAPQPGERVLDVACGTGSVGRTSLPWWERMGRWWRSISIPLEVVKTSV